MNSYKDVFTGRPKSNESFNSMIWERLPKTKYAGLTTPLELATYDALAHFNIGSKAAVMTFEKLDMIPGKYCVRGCSDINASRIRRSVYKGTAQARKRRKIIRGQSNKKNSGQTCIKAGCEILLWCILKDFMLNT